MVSEAAVVGQMVVQSNDEELAAGWILKSLNDWCTHQQSIDD